MDYIVDKLKAFFRKPIVMFAEAVLLILMVIILGIAGVNAYGFEKITTIAIAATGAIDAVGTMLASVFDKQKKITEE